MQKRNTTTYSHFEEHEKKVGKICYTGTRKQNQLLNQNITTGVVSASTHRKPVDEDLYKIPSEILHNSKRVSLSSLLNSKSCVVYKLYIVSESLRRALRE